MTIMAQDVGIVTSLKARFNNVWPTSKDLILKLFVNDVTPADTDTAATYTEATGGGYAAKTLTCGSWIVSIVGGIAQATYVQQTFTFTGPLTTNQNVYGYYVVDGDGVLQWSDRFTAFVTPVSNGNYVAVTPVFQSSKGTPT